MKEKILISACLLGTPCRYDGRSKPLAKANKLSERYDLIPICPEVMGGLETPRLPCEIREEKVIRSDGKDMTAFYQKGAESTLILATAEHCKISLLKEKSPSCGTHFRYDGSFSGTLIKGNGITARLLFENGIKIYSEDEIEELLK